MLRFLSSVSPLPLYRPDDGTGSGDPAGDDAAAAANTGADGGGSPPAGGAAPAADAGSTESGGAAGPQGEGSQARPQRDWRDNELRRKHARVQALEAENQQLREIAASAARTRPAAEAAGNGAAPAPQAPTPAVETERRAREIAKQMTLEDKLASAVTAGQSAHGKKWDDALTNLQQLGGFDPDTLAGLLATDDPTKVLFELGSKPDQYHRIMDLPPARRLAEMVKLALPPAGVADGGKKEGKKAPSEAPPPVEHISGGNGQLSGGKIDLYDKKFEDDSNDAAWYAARAEQKRASKGRPWSPRP